MSNRERNRQRRRQAKIERNRRRKTTGQWRLKLATSRSRLSKADITRRNLLGQFAGEPILPWNLNPLSLFGGMFSTQSRRNRRHSK